jgi:hypothetical protein
VSEPTVTRSVRRLHKRGHLRVIWGAAGRHHSNQYWMVEKTGAAKPLPTSKKPSRVKVFEERKPTSVNGKPTSGANKTYTAVKENHKENYLGNQRARAAPHLGLKKGPTSRGGGAGRKQPTADVAAAEAAAFKRFCLVHPRPGEKRATEREFKSAIERASAEQIIEGARRYAAQRAADISAGDEACFTLGAVRWLSEDRWNNDLDRTVIDQYGNSVVAPRTRRRTAVDDIDAEVEAILASGFRLSQDLKRH